ncbi:sulfotransferase [Pseudohongiella acticola]|nr:sulfotransferase [Pseudohongiella acticola]
MIIAKAGELLQRLIVRRAKQPTGICVLGMHRSGTSFVTGSLQSAGASLYRFHSHNPFNLKGNRENPDVVALNDDVLHANGGSWDQPPSKVNWHPEHDQRAIEILTALSAYPVWAFKDPRTLLTLEGWQRHAPDIRYVGIFRHPARVVRSLHSRDQTLSHEDGEQLWLAYNQRLLALRQRQEFPLLCFDVAPDILLQQLQRVCTGLGLDGDRATDFFEHTLINQSAGNDSSEQQVSEHSLALYAQLQGYCSLS